MTLCLSHQNVFYLLKDGVLEGTPKNVVPDKGSKTVTHFLILLLSHLYCKQLRQI